MGGFNNDGFLKGELEWHKLTVQNIKDYVPNNMPGTYFFATAESMDKVVYIGKGGEGSTTGVRERLLSYLTKKCHNPDVSKALKKGCLYFMFRYSKHPGESEAFLIQAHRIVSDGFNRRNEWKYLDGSFKEDADGVYATIAGTVLKKIGLGKEEIMRLKRIKKYEELRSNLGYP